MTWAIFAQLVGSLGFPIVAIAVFAVWYSKQEEKRRQDDKDYREKQRKDDLKRDADYRLDCKEREIILNQTIKESNENNRFILEANKDLMASNKELLESNKIVLDTNKSLCDKIDFKLDKIIETINK